MRPGHIKILNLLLVLLGAMHAFACMYWRVKIESSSGEEVSAFLEAKGVDPKVRSSSLIPGLPQSLAGLQA